MKLEELKPFSGSKHKPKRIGRGPGSGHGKTSCRGHKGQKARSGADIKPGFEGGQQPLYKRVPKRGFVHLSEDYAIVNIRDLNNFEGEVTPEELVKAGVIKKSIKRIKILGEGDINKALTVKAHAFSENAKSKIENAGGKIIIAGGN